MITVHAVSRAGCVLLKARHQWSHGRQLWSVACTVQPVEMLDHDCSLCLDCGLATGCSSSDRYWSAEHLNVRLQSLYVIHSGTLSQCISLSSGLTCCHVLCFLKESLKTGFIKNATDKLKEVDKFLGTNQWFAGDRVSIDCTTFVSYDNFLSY